MRYFIFFLFAAINSEPALSQTKRTSDTLINHKVREVIVICKTHFDIGYTHRVNEIVQYYRTEMIDRALKVMEESKNLPKDEQFNWTAPAWVMYKVLEDWKGQSPERRQKLNTAFKTGRFLTHALPFTLESDASDPEDITRGLYFAAALARKYNVPLPYAAKVTDVPAHSPALATVLANGGIKFLHIGCNWPSGYVRTPGLFYWQGPDGSKILTLYSPIYGTCYGDGLYPKDWVGRNDPMVGKDLMPPSDWPYEVWPAIIVTPDNSGPPKPENIEKLFAEIHQKMPAVKVRMGTFDDFANAILAKNLPLPVVKANMPDTWIHGIMCDPGGSKTYRTTLPQLIVGETLNRQLKLWGVKNIPVIDDSIAMAYEKTNLYSEHTWGRSKFIREYGPDFKKLDPGSYKDLEASWEDKTDYVRRAAAISKGIMANDLDLLAKNVKYTRPSVIVYNPLPWKRSGLIEVNGQKIFVNNIAPMGYTTIALNKTPTKEKVVAGNTIENEFYTIKLNPETGSISSLFDKRNKREWVDAASGFGLGQYMNERFSYDQTLNYTLAYQDGRAYHIYGAEKDWPHHGMHKPGLEKFRDVPYRAIKSGNGQLKITKDEFSQTAILDMPADTANHFPASSLKIVLTKDQPYIDMEITIKDKSKDNWPEADWLCLPFKVAQPEFNVRRPLGEMNPVTDILPGANKYLYSVGAGVTITDHNGQGIAVAPLDHPLISIDTPGIWKFSFDYAPKRPIVYLNLYNNQWNTNFRYWYPGTWSSRVRISTFNSSTAQSDIIANGALEAKYPLQTIVTGKHKSTGYLPAQQKGIELSRKGSVITDFGKNIYGEGTSLRVWEQSGTSGNCIVTFPKEYSFKTATPVNLRGEKTGDPIKIINHSLSFELKGYQPKTFVLQ